MNGWDALRNELDAWQGEGRTATLWWRDDDATRATPELARLLALSRDHRTPVALAVIPRDAEPSLGEAVDDHPQTALLQHGWGHQNHADGDDRQDEYGPHRPLDVRIAEIGAGWRRLTALPRALPVFVAPWNRMDETLLPHLPGAGIAAVSTLGPRPAAEPAPGLRRTNVHVDIIDWQGSRGFMGDDAALAQVVHHLAARRLGEVDGDEPTGLMTHHLFHDAECWRFIADLLRTTANHTAARWLYAREAFWP